MNVVAYRDRDRSERDDAYNSVKAVPNCAELLRDFSSRSWLLRHQYPRFTEYCYGEHARQRVDFFSCGKTHAPMLVFIHGGYWQYYAKETFGFIAKGPVKQGWNVAVLGYTLAPEQTLTGIVEEVRGAIRWLRKRAFELGSDASRLVVAGSEAGGHLASLLLDEPGVMGGLSMSGIYDLEPLSLCSLNEQLQLTTTDIELLSPLRMPCVDKPLLTVCGDQELPEIRRQMAEFVAYRGTLCREDRSFELVGHNQFTLLQELESETGQVTQVLVTAFGTRRFE